MRIFVWIALSLVLAFPQDTPKAGPGSLPAVSSKIWIDKHDAFDAFIRDTPIANVEEVAIGVTHPSRAHFAPGGLVDGVILKVLPPGRHSGFWDSYKSEIAAYELDKLIHLDMVPPTVEKRIKGELGSAQLWVDRCVWLKTLKGQQSPDIAAWNRQVYRQRVWDNLIGNIDRNEGNLLVDPAWNLILIDHSRAFVSDTPPADRMWFPARLMTHIDRQILDALRALDEPTLKSHLDQWLVNGVKSILKRRDTIVAHFDNLIKQQGEAAVIVP